MLRAVCTIALATLAVAPANAHPGNHDKMSWLELARHYAEPDHLAFLVLTVGVGIAAFRWGRRIEARAHAARRDDRRGDR